MSVKRIFTVGAYVLIALALLVWIAVLGTQTHAFREWARGLAERQVTRLVNGEVTIGRLDGNLFTGAQLTDVRVRQDGREIVVIERANARYDVRRLLQTDLALTGVTLIRPRILLLHDDDGWGIARLLRPRSSHSPSTRTFAIESLTIQDGTVVIEDGRPVGDGARLPERFTGLDSTLRFFAGGGRVELDIARSTFRTEAPALDVRSAAGRLVSGDALQLQQFRIRTARSAIDVDGVYQGGDRAALVRATIAASPLHIDEFAGYVPGLAGRALAPTFTAVLNGRMDALDVNATLTEPRAGSIRAQVIADLTTPTRGVRGAVTTERLDLATLLNRERLASRLTGNMDVNLTVGPSASVDAVAGQVVVHSTTSEFAGYRYEALDGTVKIAGRQFAIDASANAYDAGATVMGTLTAGDDGVGYDLHGFVRNVDLGKLSAQLPVPSLETTIAGAYTARGVGGHMDGTIAFETSKVEGAIIEAGSRGSVNLTGEVPGYGFEGCVMDLDIERVGRALQIEALSTDRFASRLTGRLTLDGAGRDVATLRLDATANLERSTIFDTTLNAAAIDARIADRTLSASLQGDFASLNLAHLAQREQLEGEIAGAFDVRATVAELGQPVTLDTVAAEGTVRLGPSTIGPLAIETAALEGRYADRGANVTSLSIKGRDLDVTASGPLMLGDSGESQLKYHVAHGRLEDLGPLLGRDLAGRLTLDGTVAGNGTRLTTEATANVAPLRVDTTVNALEVESTFEASLENLRADTLHVAADVESTLPTLGWQSFKSLSAKIMYENSALQFDTTLREEGRTVTGTGQLRVLEEGREIRVEQLAVSAGKMTWASAPGKAFTATFERSGLLNLDEVVLTSGDQRLTAAGSVSLKPGIEGTLDVRVDQADLAGLGTILLVQRRLGGALNASGQITGDAEHRIFTGQLAVANGLVDGFMFQSLDASLRYDRGRVGVDATLLQAPGAELTVKGELATSTEGPGADEPLDLNVKTNGIDLAVLQAASTAVEAVSGLLTADLHVGGTAAAPRMDGSISVQKGAFTVAATGGIYTGATLDVALQGDQLTIKQLRVFDDDLEMLEGSGSLHLEGRQVHGIDLTLTANQFEVLDNELGELSVNTTLNVDGTLLSPKITGLVRVHAGRLEVDALVDRFTTNAYATETDAPAEAKPDTPAAPAMGPELDVTVEVPGNLVLRGTDIRPATAGVALGDLNLTVGGDFSIRKEAATDPVLRGSMTTVRGTYDFQGRRFDLLRDGTIAFRGERPIDPALDLEAERVISGIVAHVNIDGTMRQPSLTVSSRPPLEEADILSLIIFNQPLNRLGEGQRADLGERAVGLASGFVVSPVSDSLENALDVDLFEIQTSTDDGGGPAVTIGEQVGERLFVRLRQIFGTQDATEFRLEYQFADFLRLQGSFAEGSPSANRSLTRRVERGGVDLVVFFSY